MTNNLVILFHFFNLAFGLTTLLYYSRRMSNGQSALQKLFIQQALFYNLAVLFTAVLDFMFFFFWKQVLSNIFSLNFLAVIRLSNLIASILWCYCFIMMIYSFLDINPDVKNKLWFKVGTILVVMLLFVLFVCSVFKVVPILAGIISLFFGYAVFIISLGYSIFLFKKSGDVTNSDRRKSLKAFGALFIFFSVISLYVYIDSYPLHLLSLNVRQFALNILDFTFNSFSFFWVIKYFKYMNNGHELAELKSLPEDELVTKFQISKRELEVIHLVCSGKSNQEIADSLFISIGTVKDHLYKIYKKIGVKNRTQLAKLF